MALIHKEGRRIVWSSLLIFISLGISTYGFFKFSIATYIIWAFLLLSWCFVLYFFRYPKRVSTASEEYIVAPCDGKVVIVEEVFEPEFLKEKVMQVSIFMSVFNVHINWYPTPGRIEYYKYHPGKYLVAWHPKSSTLNERTTTVITKEDGWKVLMRQIAGLVARRIVCYSEEGNDVKSGQEIGFIKFGSRVDLFFPLGTDIKVKVDEKVKGCQTIIAKK